MVLETTYLYLTILRTKVAFYEEAREALEAQISTLLLSSIQHANPSILIGDHLQLRPQMLGVRGCEAHISTAAAFDRTCYSPLAIIFSCTRRCCPRPHCCLRSSMLSWLRPSSATPTDAGYRNTSLPPLTALLPSIEHVVLISDYLQLRSQVLAKS